ncbi:NUDIX hydrolase N-terminal domain-containing protein [Ulvibacterium sp.]|uniref:NUDIX hydrolase n=1 Tax=Ulvibacterium sp. TaxID=2665914 RepID=UPI0026023965|nr:NUDIX hydrolase [Ulvibacterium sp.]
MKDSDQLNLVKRIQALSDTGLVYCQNEYDRERFEELRDISLRLLATMADHPLSVLQDFYMPVTDYPTPKVDVRGFVLNDAKEVLMVKESEDDKWTIPGGWADVGYSPSEVVVKEIEEETGFKTNAVRLLAIYDKKCHPHPPQPFYIYKLNFLCKIYGGELKPSFDIKDVGFFPIDRLPELSEDRILKSQLKQLYKLVMEDDSKAYFD